MAKASTKWLPLFKSYISHLKIQSKHAAEDLDGTGIALDMWTSQTLVLEQICDGIENGVHVFYILKSRQLGVTTITLAILLFWLALHPNTIGCLVSDSDKNAAKNRETIRRYLASLAPFMGKTFSAIKDNRYGFVFSNGSRLDLLVAGKSKVNWGEGEGYTVGHLCVAPGTPVIVADGRVKPIEDIKVGDLVMTHTGGPTRVVDVVGQPNHKGPMMRITPWLGQGVTCSPDHTIPTQRGVIEARDIRKGDFVVMPIPEITSEVFEVKLPETSAARAIMRVDEIGRYSKTGAILREREPWVNTVSAGSGAIVPLTKEFGFAIGYYLAEGTVIWQPGNIRPCGITFTRHRCEKSYADRAIAALLPYTTGTRRTVDRADSLTSQETIGGSSLARWIATTFGCGDDKIIPDDVFLWGKAFCRGLITGLLTGDGSKKEAFAQGYATNTMVLPSTRASLALQARDLVAALGLGWASIRYEEGGDRYGRNCKPIWRAMWFGSAAGSLREMIGLPIQPGGHKAGEKYRISGGLVYLKIRKIEDGIEVPYMWDISVEHSDHTFRTPFMSIGNTEVASYGKEEGLESFRHAMAPDNPRSLYLFEGTAKGPNHWKDMWEAAKEDVYSSRCIFVGWWSNNLQRIKRSDRRFQAFGTLPPTPEENEKITAVKRLYEYDITMEQLAWYRWEATRPNASSTDLDQNQPWIDTDAFIQSGVSFFQQKLITNRREEITSAPPVGVEDGGYGYKAYSFYLADEYHLSKVEAITTAVDPSSIKLRVWEHPHPDGLYIIGVDPAGGRSEDSNAHCCSVWRAFADKLVQVAEWADSVPDTRHCAWVTAYLAGQYQNCRINIDLTGGVGSAVMQAFDDLKTRMRSELYQAEINRYATLERRNREMERPNDPKAPNGMFNFEDFLTASSWYLYRRIDAPGPGYSYNTKLGRDLKWRTMNMMRDSWVTNVVEIRSVPLLDEMVNIVQTKADIGAAAVGRQRDDRTFAMSLANFTWLENLRGGLISQGITWEGSRAKESGEISPIADTLNRRIYGILRAADEMQDLPPPKSFYEHRGL